MLRDEIMFAGFVSFYPFEKKKNNIILNDSECQKLQKR